MNGHRFRLAAFAALAALATSSANAQQFTSLGELLDRGAKRVSGTELMALLPGATLSGKIMRPGSLLEFEATYSGDGTLVGRLYGLSATANPGMQGTWTVNEQGLLCTVVMTMATGQARSCVALYSLGNAYFMAASDERSAFIRPRKITRQ